MKCDCLVVFVVSIGLGNYVVLIREKAWESEVLFLKLLERVSLVWLSKRERVVCICIWRYPNGRLGAFDVAKRFVCFLTF
jgi:hypothetical protein